MIVKCHAATSDNKTLTLSWIPNERLKKNHDLIYNGPRTEDEEAQRFSYQSENESDTYSISSVIVTDTYKPSENKTDDPSTSPLEVKCEEISISSDKNEKLKDLNEEDNDSGIATKSSSSLTVTTVSDESNQNSPDGEKYHEGRASCSDETNSHVCPSDENDSKSDFENNIRAKEEIPAIETGEVDKLLEVLTINEEEISVENKVTKNRYISSSESSSDNGRQTETTEAESSFQVETEAESSFQVETNDSEDEISLDSSTDLQASPPPRYFSSKARDQWYDRSAESMAISANLAFPESPSTVSSLCPTPVEGGSSPVRRLHKCGIFSVDLGQMKSLRLFFSDSEKTCGQLVIASQESQYKILHFHHGGLDKLASIFEDWNFLVNPLKRKNGRKSGQDQIDSPTDPALKQFSDGAIEDDLSLRRTIFLGGVEPQLRTNVWPFLLHYYDFRTTFIERQNIMEEKHQLYARINVARENMTTEEKERFWKSVQCTVEKDVVRTDRSKPCFAGPNNPNIEKMKNILLNFAYYNPEIGYTQGMSDILAPILAEVRNEADVFWCFTGMMSKTVFVTSPRDQDMEKNLRYLGELLRLIVPEFYKYVKQQDDGLDLLFCHRWILLCFKREFNEDTVLAMWEACWSNYQTDYFHLFLVVAIIGIYGRDVWEQKMRPDEMLLYFTSLANHMDGRNSFAQVYS
ncbi:TBC1 domain family member 16 [Armadillidium vulgare]|nr:TBC1 domain family member 16 [Armadillidium vulgare]